MPFLIDGHNLIGQTPGLRLDDPDDELKLIELLRRYLTRVQKKGTVVFDRAAPGEQPRLSRGRLSVWFARAPRTADDVILELVRRERNPRGLTVVSSDQRVMNAARQARARVTASAAFAREMLAAPALSVQKEKGLSAAEVEAWEKEFSASKRRPK